MRCGAGRGGAAGGEGWLPLLDAARRRLEAASAAICCLRSLPGLRGRAAGGTASSVGFAGLPRVWGTSIRMLRAATWPPMRKKVLGECRHLPRTTGASDQGARLLSRCPWAAAAAEAEAVRCGTLRRSSGPPMRLTVRQSSTCGQLRMTPGMAC